MTEEDRKEVMNIIEGYFLRIPKLVMQLYAEEIKKNKMRLKFFADNKEFNENLDVVGKTIEEIEGNNPGIEYQKILDMATPVIKDRIVKLKSADCTITDEKPRDLTYLGNL